MVEQLDEDGGVPEPVGSDELNAWKRGFTPQAEIWNGRLAMIGLSAGLAVILLVRVFAGG
ncbi:MAG: chlorophyll a/b-binding protein [Cyanobacteriota bacterium]|nr:chlorophyll a/b-binding protein [Cyanobacteriota bacterium]